MSNLIFSPELVADGASRQRPPYLALIIIDSSCRVRFNMWDGQEYGEVDRFLCDDGTRLRPEIESQVAKFIAEIGPEDPLNVRLVLHEEDRALRFSRLVSKDETLFAVIVERDSPYDQIARATARFKLTKRQAEVLVLVLEGASASEIAQQLSISEYTAQGYLKTLLTKTESRNRAAMASRVLEWRRPPQTATAPASRRNGTARASAS